MKRLARLTEVAAAGICAAMLAGCFSIDTAHSSTMDSEHVLVMNSGWWLFNAIPICCGNAASTPENHGPWAFFRNDVTMEKVQGRFMEYTHSRGLDASELVYRNTDRVIFSIPFTNIPVPLPYLLCYREIQLSGVLK